MDKNYNGTTWIVAMEDESYELKAGQSLEVTRHEFSALDFVVDGRLVRTTFEDFEDDLVTSQVIKPA